jgi:hypothetical protein
VVQFQDHVFIDQKGRNEVAAAERSKTIGWRITMLGRSVKGAEGPWAELARVVSQYIEGAAVGVRRAAGGKRYQKGGKTAQKRG